MNRIDVLAGVAIGAVLIAHAFAASVGCTPQQRQDVRSALEIASLACGAAETVTQCIDRLVPVTAPPPAPSPAACAIAPAKDGGRD